MNLLSHRACCSVGTQLDQIPSGYIILWRVKIAYRFGPFLSKVIYVAKHLLPGSWLFLCLRFSEMWDFWVPHVNSYEERTAWYPSSGNWNLYLQVTRCCREDQGSPRPGQRQNLWCKFISPLCIMPTFLHAKHGLSHPKKANFFLMRKETQRGEVTCLRPQSLVRASPETRSGCQLKV